MRRLSNLSMEDVEMGREGEGLFPSDEELEAITLALQAWRPIEDETLPEEDRTRWSNTRRHLLHDLGLEVVATP